MESISSTKTNAVVDGIPAPSTNATTTTTTTTKNDTSEKLTPKNPTANTSNPKTMGINAKKKGSSEASSSSWFGVWPLENPVTSFLLHAASSRNPAESNKGTSLRDKSKLASNQTNSDYEMVHTNYHHSATKHPSISELTECSSVDLYSTSPISHSSLSQQMSKSFIDQQQNHQKLIDHTQHQQILQQQQQELEKQRRMNHELSVLALGSDYALIQSLMQQSAKDDIIVDKLLTQFPTYGANQKKGGLSPSHSPKNTNNNKYSSTNNTKDPHVDFWLGPFASNVTNNNSSSITNNNSKNYKSNDDNNNNMIDEIMGDYGDENGEYDGKYGGSGYQDYYDGVDGWLRRNDSEIMNMSKDYFTTRNRWSAFPSNASNKFKNNQSEQTTGTTTNNSATIASGSSNSTKRNNNNSNNSSNSNTGSNSNKSNSLSGNNKKIELDWDEDEKNLWRKRSPSPTHRTQEEQKCFEDELLQDQQSGGKLFMNERGVNYRYRSRHFIRPTNAFGGPMFLHRSLLSIQDSNLAHNNNISNDDNITPQYEFQAMTTLDNNHNDLDVVHEECLTPRQQKNQLNSSIIPGNSDTIYAGMASKTASTQISVTKAVTTAVGLGGGTIPGGRGKGGGTLAGAAGGSGSINQNNRLYHDDERQYWMPDQLCKNCYACEIPFTVFRRRHHCRLCGQVFCNSCSAYFVPSSVHTSSAIPSYQTNQPLELKTSTSVTGTITNSSVSSTNSNTNNSSTTSHITGTQMVPTNATTTSVNTTNSTTAGGITHSATSSSNSSTIRVCKLCYDQVTLLQNKTDQQQQVPSQQAQCHPPLLFSPQNKYSHQHSTSPTTATVFHVVNPTLHQSHNADDSAEETHNHDDDVGSMDVGKRSVYLGEVPLPSSMSRNINKSNKTLQVPLQSTNTPSRGLLNDSKTTQFSSGDVSQQDESLQGKSQVQHCPNQPSPLSEEKSNSQSLQGEYVPQTMVSDPGTQDCLKENQTIDDEGIDELSSSKEFSSVEDGNRHLGLCAARHLEEIAKELLRLHAPLLWNRQFTDEHDENERKLQRFRKSWINKLLTLATKCCATVNPNVKKGDYLDIRPYIKVKVISGSTYHDCQYLSGVLFRKNVTHKRMAREVVNPRIMLLSGGIEFSRAGTENRIASLETLFEQEDTYTEILVGKILKLQPDVLIIGRSASRKAQELLLAAGVILIQHVKVNLLSRISRQTGATIISNTDHVMNRFGPNVLGKCCRFRLVTFRDNEAWTEEENIISSTVKTNVSTTIEPKRKSIKQLLADPNLVNYERQAALAASQLGEKFMDGAEAVQSGLCKRGVAQTYIILEGCPKHLGCTIVLRGASAAALKQVKTVFRFLTNTAYNLKLETCYLRERGARICPRFQVIPRKHTYSSSLCVDYGTPPGGRKVRPWNGGNNDMSASSTSTSTVTTSTATPDTGEITAFDHQSILITSVWMTDKTQCCPAEVKGICYYSRQDVSLGQFLRDSCFNLSLKCQNPNCKKSVLDHTLSFVHNDGLINISVEEMGERLPPSPFESPNDDRDDSDPEDDDVDSDRPIATWTYCQNCRRVVTPLVYISENTWKWSFGKFLEVFFYNRDAVLNAPHYQCSCQLQTSATLYYGCGKLAARFTYERITPYNVFVRRFLPIEFAFHRKAALHHLGIISVASSELFVRFDKHIEKVSREARFLFNSPINRPEHLQTVLSELNRIGSEVDHAAKTLQEKIASITDNCRRQEDWTMINAALFRFPWFARRYLFNLTSAWNEKLRYAGQAISAMKKIAASASASSSRNESGVVGLGPNVVVTANVGGGDHPYNEELTEGMKRLRQLIDHYANLNVTDITQVLPSFPGNTGGDVVHDPEYDDDFDCDHESTSIIDFSDGIDADVLASRRRYNSKLLHSPAATMEKERKGLTEQPRPSKALGTRRSLTDRPRLSHSILPSTTAPSTSHDLTTTSASTTSTSLPKPTPGGAVKSAITRFFNRGGRDYEQYVVPLGIFTEGRPRLSPGVNGIVLPVRDEHLSTIIAYSLASLEYAKQFKQFSSSRRHTGGDDVSTGIPGSTSDYDEEVPHISLIEKNRKAKPDLDAGIENINHHDSRGIIERPPEERMSSHHPISSRSSSYTPNSPPSSSHTHHKNGPTTAATSSVLFDDFRENQRRMLSRTKSHIKHTFRDIDEKGHVSCKFVCTTYWATQFHAVRQVFLSSPLPTSGKLTGSGHPSDGDQQPQYGACINTTQSGSDVEQSYIESLSSAEPMKMTGGKSGASFARTSDDRFVIKCISRTELQMFLDCAPTYFEYLTKAFFHGIPTVLCKIVGVYQVGVHNKVTGKRSMEQVAVMQNIFYKRRITKIFDLKGSLRGRFASQKQEEVSVVDTPTRSKRRAIANNKKSEDQSGQGENKGHEDDELDMLPPKNPESGPVTMLDGDFLEFTMGRPMPLTDQARAVFQMSILNDTLFLSMINVLDYSVLIGVDEDSMDLVVGIIDFMRQYDILKQMERVGKSLPMVVGSEAPTIIQPPLYKARFTNAMERYFMTVPSKWTTI